jgi:hypothetical protein
MAKLRRAEYERNEKMHILYGTLTVAAGLFLVVCGSRRSEFFIYRLLVARSRILWGEKVHRFHQVAGVMVIVFGLLLVLGYIQPSE